MPILCFVFDLDDVLLQTTSIFASPTVIHTIRSTPDIVQAYKQCISPDPELYRKLQLLRGPKFILTNASRAHAYASIQALHLQPFFVGQLDADSGTQLKPASDAYVHMQHIINQQIPTTDKLLIFFDDRVENLIVPHQMGWVTVWIEPRSVPLTKPDHVSFAFANVNDAISFFIGVQ